MKVPLLIIDEVDLQPLSRPAANLVLRVAAHRYQRGRLLDHHEQAGEGLARGPGR